ncbi:NAD(P)H-binding protein [Streptomyces sp. NPDC001795]|uniref:NAD(P)H-binding protein n=1 Tax=unclassified Streptomyces TaxID=2593676 RepID=UPI003327630F
MTWQVRSLRSPETPPRSTIKKIADETIRSSGLDWTLVHPTRLTHGPAGGSYRADDRLPMNGNPTISRADVAAFMHQAVHSSEWIHRTAVVSD